MEGLYRRFRAAAEAQGLGVEAAQPIEHGLQFRVRHPAAQGLVRVYGGKKGVRLDFSQVRDEALKALLLGICPEAVLAAPIAGPGRADGAAAADPLAAEAIIGCDESGKGDYFGPLVAAAVYLPPEQAELWRTLGLADSKTLADGRIKELARQIEATLIHHVVLIAPPRYNELYPEFRNVNRLLAWAHAAAIEEVAARAPAAAGILIDQFAADPRVVSSALKPRARALALHQRPRAEAHMAVAAASVLARDRFVSALQRLSRQCGVHLAKGAGPPVIASAKRLVAERGAEALRAVAKLHFKTTQEVVPDERQPAQ